MRILTEQYVEEGGDIPIGYGVAWRDWSTNHIVCLPLGLNVIAATMRRCYHWIVTKHTPSVIDVAYERGRRDERDRRRLVDERWAATVDRLTKNIQETT